MTARTLLSRAAGLTLLASSALLAQTQAGAPEKPKDPYRSPKFWESTAPFALTLSVNLKQLQADKGDPGPWRSATVAYADTTPRTHAARLRTRGRSRLKICDRFPPIWVDFAKEDVKGSTLQRVNRFKLVAPCKYAPDYERYVLAEYNLYRVHELFTPVSHRTRLIKLTVKDSASGKEAFTKYAFAIEDLEEVSERVGGVKLPVQGLVADDMNTRQLALMGLLQYMIGNTDFSYSAKHNLEFINTGGTIYPINFDYDQSGIINAPYAIPDPSVGVTKVTQRVYRGLCVPVDTLRAVIADLKAKRPQLEALYKDDLGKLMGSMMTSSSLRYIDDFYADIGNERILQREIVAKCRKG